ncbi:hypothetical protein AVEN_268635-1 [Araneus ventricosus]|uniref:Uncharacterized protein n=1 Tax=Araneus ventricosus TaxID=182803 RepID=A0A4Y2R9T7_ARAVE|nr:hypothetical protein AVEN_207872-1 [Araneus ventricosus]GBN72434.1 hypothetical protein AVEN_268635-1 [Araneus ventricosus]
MDMLSGRSARMWPESSSAESIIICSEYHHLQRVSSSAVSIIICRECHHLQISLYEDCAHQIALLLLNCHPVAEVCVEIPFRRYYLCRSCSAEYCFHSVSFSLNT